jgi:ADP-ribose pyrophosphatase YjhB (NUDIX family)
MTRRRASLSNMSDQLPISFGKRVPDGDTHERDICEHCGYVAYQNPKIVVGSVVRDSDRILMCRRAIAPRIGFWTIPAGYLEMHETPAEGARREAREEADADLALDGLLAVYTVPRLSQVQLIFRATLATPHFAAGIESQEVELFSWEDIPWNELAFPTVGWMLNHERQVQDGRAAPPFGNPPGKESDLRKYAAGG